MISEINIRYKKLHSEAKKPEQAKDGDAGYDLFALESATLLPFERKVIKTGLAIEIPKGCYGRVAPRSGLAVKAGIDVMAGVVDSGYRNEVGVVLINLDVLGWLQNMFKAILGKNDSAMSFQSIFGAFGRFQIEKGDKIAQLIIEKCHKVNWIESEVLDDSDRNLGGFGSTGK